MVADGEIVTSFNNFFEVYLSGETVFNKVEKRSWVVNASDLSMKIKYHEQKIFNPIRRGLILDEKRTLPTIDYTSSLNRKIPLSTPIATISTASSAKISME
jgi:hypothetical protein